MTSPGPSEGSASRALRATQKPKASAFLPFEGMAKEDVDKFLRDFQNPVQTRNYTPSPLGCLLDFHGKGSRLDGGNPTWRLVQRLPSGHPLEGGMCILWIGSNFGENEAGDIHMKGGDRQKFGVCVTVLVPNDHRYVDVRGCQIKVAIVRHASTEAPGPDNTIPMRLESKTSADGTYWVDAGEMRGNVYSTVTFARVVNGWRIFHGHSRPSAMTKFSTKSLGALSGQVPSSSSSASSTAGPSRAPTPVSFSSTPLPTAALEQEDEDDEEMDSASVRSTTNGKAKASTALKAKHFRYAFLVAIDAMNAKRVGACSVKTESLASGAPSSHKSALSHRTEIKRRAAQERQESADRSSLQHQEVHAPAEFRVPDRESRERIEGGKAETKKRKLDAMSAPAPRDKKSDVLAPFSWFHLLGCSDFSRSTTALFISVSFSASGTPQKDSVVKTAKSYESTKCCLAISASHRTLLSDVSMDAMEAPMIANALVGLGYPTSSSLDDDAPNLGPVVSLCARIGIVQGAKSKPEQEIGLRGVERSAKMSIAMGLIWGHVALRSILDGVALNPARQISADLQPPEITHLFDMAAWFEQMTGHKDLVRTLRAAVDAGMYLPDRFGNFADLPLLDDPMDSLDDLFYTMEGAATETDAESVQRSWEGDNAGSSSSASSGLQMPFFQEEDTPPIQKHVHREDDDPPINPTRPGDLSRANSPAPEFDPRPTKKPKAEKKPEVEKDRGRDMTPLKLGLVPAKGLVRYVPPGEAHRSRSETPQIKKANANGPAMTPSAD